MDGPAAKWLPECDPFRVDQNDPEQRIRDLEGQLAEQPTRSFMATTARLSTWLYVYTYVSLAAWAALMYAAPKMLGQTTGWVVVALVGLGIGIAPLPAILRSGPYKKIRIRVTSDGLTVDRGQVFPFGGAKLSPWTAAGQDRMSGTALHLQCGPHRFVLGGRDHRVGAAARLDAPRVGHVDGWLSAADFDEVLTMAGRRSA